jgi:hypothetical protein
VISVLDELRLNPELMDRVADHDDVCGREPSPEPRSPCRLATYIMASPNLALAPNGDRFPNSNSTGFALEAALPAQGLPLLTPRCDAVTPVLGSESDGGAPDAPCAVLGAREPATALSCPFRAHFVPISEVLFA